jgi:hypothetical protein
MAWMLLCQGLPSEEIMKPMPRQHPALLAFLAVSLAGSAAALAQPSATEVEPPDETVVVSAADPGVLADVNADRAWLSPTALTQPKGSWAFNDYELFFVGATYGVTDSFQISATTMVPITTDQPLFLNVAGKAQVLRQGNLRLALHGVLYHVSDDGSSDDAATLGGAATLCLDAGCHSLFNVYGGFAVDLSGDEGETPVLLAAALVKQVTKRVKLVGEIDTAFVVGEYENDQVYLGWYGLRFTSSAIGADIGFVKPLGEDFEDEDEFPMGLPWLNFTYRSR